jgi:hypothetical protein
MYSCLSWALDADGQSHDLTILISRKSSITHCRESWVGHQAGLKGYESEKISFSDILHSVH